MNKQANGYIGHMSSNLSQAVVLNKTLGTVLNLLPNAFLISLFDQAQCGHQHSSREFPALPLQPQIPKFALSVYMCMLLCSSFSFF